MAADSAALTIIMRAQDQASGKIKGVAGAMGFLKQHARGLIAGFGMAGVAGAMAAAVKKTADYGEEMLRLSKITGISTENMGRLKYTAEQNEVSMEAVTQSFKFLAKHMAATKDTTKDLYQAWLKHAEEVSKAAAGQERMNKAAEIFGARTGSKLIPMLALGKKAIEDFGKAAETTGILMNRETAEAADALGDKIKRLSTHFLGLQLKIGMALVPYVQKLADAIDAVATAFNKLPKGLQDKIITGTLLAGGALGANWMLRAATGAGVLGIASRLGGGAGGVAAGAGGTAAAGVGTANYMGFLSRAAGPLAVAATIAEQNRGWINKLRIVEPRPGTRGKSPLNTMVSAGAGGPGLGTAITGTYDYSQLRRHPDWNENQIQQFMRLRQSEQQAAMEAGNVGSAQQQMYLDAADRARRTRYTPGYLQLEQMPGRPATPGMPAGYGYRYHPGDVYFDGQKVGKYVDQRFAWMLAAS